MKWLCGITPYRAVLINPLLARQPQSNARKPCAKMGTRYEGARQATEIVPANIPKKSDVEIMIATIGTVKGNCVFRKNAVRRLEEWYTPTQIIDLLAGKEVEVGDDEFDFIDDEDDFID